MNDNVDDNLDDLVEQILGNPPQPPGSIQLQLEEETSYIAQKQGVEQFVFDILCMITIKGVQKLFGHKNLLKLTQDEFCVVSQYVKSYGYVLQVYANNTAESPWELASKGIPILRYHIGFDKLSQF